MKKNIVREIVVLIVIFLVVGVVIVINATYKTREEKFGEFMQSLNLAQEDYEKDSFLMSIIYKRKTEEGSIMLEGNIVRGNLSLGDNISLIGVGEEKNVKIEKIIDKNNNEVKEAKKDERVNVIISGVDEKNIQPGQVLAKKDTIKQYNKFIASIYILTPEEGGIEKTFKEGDTLNFYIRTWTFEGKIEKIKEMKKVKPGTEATIIVTLENKVALEEGTTFIIRNEDETMGAGEIVSVIK